MNADTAQFDEIRKNLTRQLSIVAREYKKNVYHFTEDREMTPQDVANIHDSLKKIEKEAAQRFLAVGNVTGYEKHMTEKKDLLQTKLNYFNGMLALRQDFFNVVQNFLAKQNLAFAQMQNPQNPAMRNPAKIEKIQHQIKVFKDYETHMNQPQTLHPKGLDYIDQVRKRLTEIVESYRQAQEDRRLRVLKE